MRCPCLTSISPSSCKRGRHSAYCARSSATRLATRMCPASPQSITRCAMLIPAPVTLRPSFTSGNLVHRSAVDAHAQLKLRMLPQIAADLLRAANGRVHGGEKGEHDSVSRRDSNQLAGCLGRLELRRIANNVTQKIEY